MKEIKLPLVRGHHSFDHSFTQIPNQWLRDNRLTFKARGLLALLLSHSEGWSLSISSLAQNNLEGKHAIGEAIHELENYGYLKRRQVNENGRFGEVVWETCDPEPLTDFPPTDNPPLKNNIDKNTNKNNKNNNQELFLEFWNQYPQKRDKGAAVRAFRSALTRAKFEDIMAGVIRYRNDPSRNPKFTKYPATWLNADSWENDYQSVDDTATERRQKEREHSQRLLAELQEQSRNAGPAPTCEHGNNLALCRLCLRNQTK